MFSTPGLQRSLVQQTVSQPPCHGFLAPALCLLVLGSMLFHISRKASGKVVQYIWLSPWCAQETSVWIRSQKFFCETTTTKHWLDMTQIWDGLRMMSWFAAMTSLFWNWFALDFVLNYYTPKLSAAPQNATLCQQFGVLPKSGYSVFLIFSQFHSFSLQEINYSG